MASYQNLEDLKQCSIRMYDGMTIVYPQFHQEEVFKLFDTAKFNDCYAVNNSTLAFVSENVLYVTPSSRSAFACLSEAGFMKSSFYVPFSNWDYPKFEKEKWDFLLKEAQETHKSDFVNDCERYCDKHDILPLSNEILSNCFQIPEGGVRVKHPHYESSIHPVITEVCLDCFVIERLGTYCYNNGRVVFVYRDGKTYVTKGYKILKYLAEAGFVKGDIFVPFSNGEIIIDPVLRSKWDNIQKQAILLG